MAHPDRSKPLLVPDSLDERLNQPVDPQCPDACCFRRLCPTRTQQGIAQLWREGRYTDRAQCPWFQHLQKLVRKELGGEPPATADELDVMMATVRMGDDL